MKVADERTLERRKMTAIYEQRTLSDFRLMLRRDQNGTSKRPLGRLHFVLKLREVDSRRNLMTK